jgi:hypothetical protein
MRRIAVSSLLLAQATISTTVSGQQDTADARDKVEGSRTGPMLERTHWAVEATRRAEVLGLIRD